MQVRSRSSKGPTVQCPDAGAQGRVVGEYLRDATRPRFKWVRVGRDAGLDLAKPHRRADEDLRAKHRDAILDLRAPRRKWWTRTGSN